MVSVKKAASTKSSTSKTKECLKCSETKPSTKFYISYSSLHADNKVPYCKDCLSQMVNVEDLESVKDILRQIDRPFLNNIWESSMKESSERERELFGTYMKNISMHQHRDKTWKDSQFGNENTNVVITTDTAPIVGNKKSFEVTYELIEKWGEGYTSDEYRRLESFYLGMKDSYEIDTESHRDYLKKICMVSLDMDKVLKKGMIDQFKKLSDVYDKLMKSAKFTAVQRSAADKTGGLNTFSEFAEFAEKQGFIPKYTIEEQDIVDTTLNNLMSFTRRLVLGDPNLANIVEDSIQKMAEKEAAIEAETIVDNFEEEEDYDLSLDKNDGEYDEEYYDYPDDDDDYYPLEEDK